MRLAHAKAEAMYTQALAEFPYECCGMIIGPEGEDIGPDDVVCPCRNIQQEQHQKDPERFPRDATRGFFMAPQDILSVPEEAKARGWVVKVLYHSHPNEKAYFSETDRRSAEGLISGEWFPTSVRFVVMSAYPEGVRDIQGYRWDDATRTFLPVPVEVVS
jgi:proteasome lid subunit RPN8/RPN11